jgi:hypothetical protein
VTLLAVLTHLMASLAGEQPGRTYNVALVNPRYVGASPKIPITAVVAPWRSSLGRFAYHQLARLHQPDPFRGGQGLHL